MVDFCSSLIYVYVGGFVCFPSLVFPSSVGSAARCCLMLLRFFSEPKCFQPEELTAGLWLASTLIRWARYARKNLCGKPSIERGPATAMFIFTYIHFGVWSTMIIRSVRDFETKSEGVVFRTWRVSRHASYMECKICHGAADGKKTQSRDSNGELPSVPSQKSMAAADI